MDRKRQNIGWLMIVSISLCTTMASGTTWYVDDDAAPGGDGSTWATAFQTIQEGVDAATDGDTVLVGDGTYSGTGNRFVAVSNESIHLRSLNGPDHTEIDYQGTTGYMSFDSATNSELEGITITNAYHSDMYSVVRCALSDMVIRNCRISHVRNNGTNSMIALDIYGGSPTITDCEFYQNDWVAVSIVDSTAKLNNCTFGGNPATEQQNTGIEILGSSDPTVQDCVFTGNAVGIRVLAWSVNAVPSVKIVNNLFLANNQHGIVSSLSNPVVTNCTFYESSIRSTDASPVISNCIIWSSEIENVNNSNPQITYSCVEDSYPGEGNIDLDPSFIHEDVENGDFRLRYGSPCIDAGNNEALPEWLEFDLAGASRIQGINVDMGVYEKEQYCGNGMCEDGETVCNCSGDCGMPTETETQCQDNQDNDCDGYVDWVDSDCECGSVIFVDADAALGGDGDTWESAFRYLRDAIAVAQPGNAIWVAAGTYHATQAEYGPAADLFELVDDVVLYGGLAGTEQPGLFSMENRDFELNSVYLQGNSDDQVVVLAEGIGRRTLFDGFSLTNHSSFQAENSSLVIRNCRFENGHWETPVLSILGGAPIVEQSQFRDTQGYRVVKVDSSMTVFRDCAITDNEGPYDSDFDAITNIDSQTTMINCIISRNSSGGEYGAGMCNWDSDVTLINCLLNDNSGYVCNYMPGGGGAIGQMGGTLTLKNCTLARNTIDGSCTFSGGGGGAIYSSSNSSVVIHNSIFWENRALGYMDNDNFDTGTPFIQSSFIESSSQPADPTFVDPDNEDFSLQASSPCKDAGNDSLVPNGITTDLNGGTRFFGAVDQGAYEFSLPAGDWDFDNDVDLYDYTGFLQCFNSDEGDCIRSFDLDQNDVIDLEDFNLFVPLITGPQP